MNPQLLPKVRSRQIMAEIRGAGSGQPFPCCLRISSFYPGHKCLPGTTVGCHLPVGPAGGKGVSTKVTDMAVAAGCFNCHQILDGEDNQILNFIQEKYPAAFAWRCLSGLVETHSLLIERGVISVDGELI